MCGLRTTLFLGLAHLGKAGRNPSRTGKLLVPSSKGLLQATLGPYGLKKLPEHSTLEEGVLFLPPVATVQLANPQAYWELEGKMSALS